MRAGTRARATIGLSIVHVALGVALIVETAVHEGGLGYVFGALFVLAGGGRLYLSLR